MPVPTPIFLLLCNSTKLTSVEPREGCQCTSIACPVDMSVNDSSEYGIVSIGVLRHVCMPNCGVTGFFPGYLPRIFFRPHSTGAPNPVCIHTRIVRGPWTKFAVEVTSSIRCLPTRRRRATPPSSLYLLGCVARAVSDHRPGTAPPPAG